MTTVKGKNRVADLVGLGGDTPTNGAAPSIEEGQPYAAQVQLVGIADILFHRWNCEAVDDKAKAAKGSKAKKTDNIESYVHRDANGHICIPGEYLRQAIIGAAKFRQDPRSPRKSAMDLFKAGVVSETLLASLGQTEWDYVDRRRAVVQRNGINRDRPAIRAGWRAEFTLLVVLPEYIAGPSLLETINAAGRLIGLGDFRPTYGRFQVAAFSVTADLP